MFGVATFCYDLSEMSSTNEKTFGIQECLNVNENEILQQNKYIL